MLIIVLGQHVSIFIESSSDTSKNTDPYLAMFKMRCGITNAYILDINMYKMHVSLCSYCTIRIAYVQASIERLKTDTRLERILFRSYV